MMVQAKTAARTLQPLLGGDREQADRDRRMTPEVLVALQAAGLFRLCAPRAVGGHEADLRLTFETIELLGEADPGAAWHVVNSIVAGLAAGSLHPDAAQALFDGASHFGFSAVPGGAARPDSAGFRLDGRWPFVTGSNRASWVGLAAVIHDGDIPRTIDGVTQLRVFYVPIDDVTVEDTWNDVIAMRSSGSNAVRADAAISPDGLSYSFSNPEPREAASIYRVAPYQVFWVSAIAVLFGVWKAALAAAVDTATNKRSSFDDGIGIDLPSVQWALAEADAERRAWRAGILEAIDHVTATIEATGVTEAHDRSPLWTSMILSSDHARSSIGRLYASGTTLAWREGHPLAKAVQDAHFITVAFERFRRLVFDAGRVLGGLPPEHPLH